MMFPQILSLIALCTSLVSAHTIMTYPGWRGDNLVTNDTFPYGMQWMYPCEYTSLVISGRRGQGTGMDRERSMAEARLSSLSALTAPSKLLLSFHLYLPLHPARTAANTPLQ